VFTKIKRNIVANFLGNSWTILVSMALIPLYIHFMGIEAYGLVGFFLVLQAMFTLLDMGLTPTMSREMARLSVLPDKAGEMRDLTRTLEIVYWVVAVVIGLAIVLFASTITQHWVKAGQLPPATVNRAIVLMGLAIALQWPITLYSGGLMGLQCQVLLNGFNIIMATLRGGGAVLVLWLISPTVQAFFVWQIFISAVRALLIAVLLWRSLPPTDKTARFKLKLFRKIWRFAAGMTGISAMALLLSQMDKIILSKMLTLKMFGYYTLATMAASFAVFIVTPIFSAIYPHITQLAALDSEAELKELYHRSCQTISVLMLPTALMISLFSQEILVIWTQNFVTAKHSSLILSVLVIGNAANGLLNMPYGLQLAYGWTRLTLISSTISVILLIPLIIFMTSKYGAMGAAVVWLILNIGYALITIPIMHRRLLPGEKWRWYVEDISYPLLAALGIIGVSRWFIQGQMSQPVTVVVLLSVYVTALAAAALVSPLVRTQIIGIANRLRVTYGV
jgi:O-antigen/teichoic acid export membrane protein